MDPVGHKMLKDLENKLIIILYSEHISTRNFNLLTRDSFHFKGLLKNKPPECLFYEKLFP